MGSHAKCRNLNSKLLRSCMCGVLFKSQPHAHKIAFFVFALFSFARKNEHMRKQITFFVIILFLKKFLCIALPPFSLALFKRLLVYKTIRKREKIYSEYISSGTYIILCRRNVFSLFFIFMFCIFCLVVFIVHSSLRSSLFLSTLIFLLCMLSQVNFILFP